MESPHKDYQEVSAVTPSRNLYGIGPRKETALRHMKLDTPGAMKDIDDDELDKRCRDAVQRMRNDDRKGGVERSDVAYKSFETKLKQDIKRVRDHAEDIVPWHLMCPISHDLLEDPVVLFTGTVFSKKHLETWVNDGKNVDPSTNIQLDSREYYPCLVLRGLVDDYKGSRMMRVPKRTPRASAGLYSASDADVGVDLCERNSTTTEQATKSGSVEGAPRTTDLEADPEVDQCEQGMQSIGVVERSASCNDDDGTMKNSTVDDVQSSPIPCTAATIVRPVMYRINQVTRAMFVHPTPYLSIGSARDTLTEAMFEVHEAEGPSGAISTPFSIRAASDAHRRVFVSNFDWGGLSLVGMGCFQSLFWSDCTLFPPFYSHFPPFSSQIVHFPATFVVGVSTFSRHVCSRSVHLLPPCL
mmetsp:Transcript_12475/g.26392  ORF Transcript_12475/g.26392 Transcript_12475/m.26392 type:complete len:413 (+) Transcript_12475:155-1393(+)